MRSLIPGMLAVSCALSASLGAQMVWSQTGLSGRRGHAVAYDAARQRVVLFGGYESSSGSERGDTWEWDGQGWTRVADRGPAPREGHAMAFDAARQRVVLFGGAGPRVVGDDTWEWDGNGRAWSRVSQAGPPPRTGHAMVWDPARQRVVLHGGADTRVRFSDTWEWDGAVRSWTQVDQVGPTPVRVGFAMAYDLSRGSVVLFGGFVGPGYLRDTWEWDGNSRAWNRVAQAGPSPRAGHAMAWDEALQRVVLVAGGVMGGSPVLADDFWAWDGTIAAWTRIAATGLTPRAGHAMAYDSARQRLCLVGGFAGYRSPEALCDTWEWDGTRWLPRGGPSPRSGHAMVWDTARQRLVLFGGGDAYRGPVGDTWEWDGAAWVTAGGSAPPPRRGHAMAFDTARGRVVLFGGSDSAGLVGPEVWEWDGSNWTCFVRSASPGPREGHAMVYDAARQRVVVFGGHDGGGYIGETWEWNGAAWSQVPGAGPPPRMAHGMAYDVARRRVVVFGGLHGRQTYFGDTWEWDGLVWTSASQTGPTPRTEHAMTYDKARERVVLCGGYSGFGIVLGDTWEWDGLTWARVLQTGPIGRAGHAVVYDASLRAVMAFGGYDWAFAHDDTWTYAPTVRGATAPVGLGCAGSAGTPTLTAPRPPIVGNQGFALAVGSVPANANVFVGMSSQLIATPAPPCTVYPRLPFAILLQGTASPSGSAELPLPIPWVPALSGADLFVQGGALDPGGVLFGALSLTPGLQIRIGD